MMEIQPGMFKIGDVEEIFLSGTYGIKLFFNKNKVTWDVERNINNQEIYDVGNILYRTETKNIDELIDVFARYTYDPCSELDLDFSVASKKIMASGTICPARNVLFAYKGKVFVAFGRYIFGYDYTNEIIKRVGADKVEDSREDSDSTDVDNESNEIVKCEDADNVEDGEDSDWTDVDSEDENIEEDFLSGRGRMINSLVQYMLNLIGPNDEIDDSDEYEDLLDNDEYEDLLDNDEYEDYLTNYNHEDLNDSSDEEWKKREGLPDLVSNDMIQLNGPEEKERRFNGGDHYYSLLIYDQETLAVDAFGLYW